MNPRDRLESFSVLAAQRKIKRDPTIKAAVMVATGTPMTERKDTIVRLFEKVGEADTFFRAKRQEFLDSGFEQTHGTIGRRMLGFTREAEDAERWLRLDKRP
jgi:hypothetical protein